MKGKRGLLILTLIALAAVSVGIVVAQQCAPGTRSVENLPTDAAARAAEISNICSSFCPDDPASCAEYPAGSGCVTCGTACKSDEGFFRDLVTCTNYCVKPGSDTECLATGRQPCRYQCVKKGTNDLITTAGWLNIAARNGTKPNLTNPVRGPGVGTGTTTSGVTGPGSQPVGPYSGDDAEARCKAACTNPGEVCRPDFQTDNQGNPIPETVQWHCRFDCSLLVPGTIEEAPSGTCTSFCTAAGKVCEVTATNVNRGTTYQCGVCVDRATGAAVTQYTNGVRVQTPPPRGETTCESKGRERGEALFSTTSACDAACGEGNCNRFSHAFFDVEPALQCHSCKEKPKPKQTACIGLGGTPFSARLGVVFGPEEPGTVYGYPDPDEGLFYRQLVGAQQNAVKITDASLIEKIKEADDDNDGFGNSIDLNTDERGAYMGAPRSDFERSFRLNNGEAVSFSVPTGEELDETVTLTAEGLLGGYVTIDDEDVDDDGESFNGFDVSVDDIIGLSADDRNTLQLYVDLKAEDPATAEETYGEQVSGILAEVEVDLDVTGPLPQSFTVANIVGDVCAPGSDGLLSNGFQRVTLENGNYIVESYYTMFDFCGQCEGGVCVNKAKPLGAACVEHYECGPGRECVNNECASRRARVGEVIGSLGTMGFAGTSVVSCENEAGEKVSVVQEAGAAGLRMADHVYRVMNYAQSVGAGPNTCDDNEESECSFDAHCEAVETTGWWCKTDVDPCVCKPPEERDSDGDGLSDGQEANIGSDPHVADLDGDGFSDYAELMAGYDWEDPNKYPGDSRVFAVSDSAAGQCVPPRHDPPCNENFEHEVLGCCFPCPEGHTTYKPQCDGLEEELSEQTVGGQSCYECVDKGLDCPQGQWGTKIACEVGCDTLTCDPVGDCWTCPKGVDVPVN